MKNEKKEILTYVIQDNINILKKIFKDRANVSRETLEDLASQLNDNNNFIEKVGI